MRRNYIVTVLINVFAASALAFLLTHLYYNYKYDYLPPFGLDEDYVAVQVSKSEPASEEVPGIIAEMHRILQSGEALVILEKNWPPELGVYDPQMHYDFQNHIEGRYFNPADFKSTTRSVLVKAQSSFHVLLNKEGFTLINGALVPVIGVYDEDFALNRFQDYIYNLLSTSDLRGTYYFASEDQSAAEQVVRLLEKHGYATNSIERPSKMVILVKNWVPSMLWCMLFIYINSAIILYILFARHTEEFKIHQRFGATKVKFFRHYIVWDLAAVFIGTLLGLLLFFGISNAWFSSLLSAHRFSFAGIVFSVNTICIGLIISLVFSAQKIWKGMSKS